MTLDTTDAAERILEASKHLGNDSRVAVLRCGSTHAVPVRSADTLHRLEESEAAFTVEETRCPGALELGGRSVLNWRHFGRPPTRGASSTAAARVLLLHQLHGTTRLSTLDVAEVWPYELENQLNLLASGEPKHVVNGVLCCPIL